MSMTDELQGESSRSKKKKYAEHDRIPAERYSGRQSRGHEKIRGERFKESEEQTSHGKDIGDRLITAAAAVVLAVCLVILGRYVYHIIEAKSNHDNIKDIYEKAASVTDTVLETLYITAAETETVTAAVTDSTAVLTDDIVSETTAPIVREPLELLPAASEMLNINSDTVGYVKIPGILDEVVVQTSDNDYYLTHNFYGTRRECGTVFADHRDNVCDYPDLMSDNIILYGHNQQDGTMFGNMDYYRWHPERWLQDPFIYFNTNYEEGVYVIIASFVTNALPEDDNGNIFDYWNYINLSDQSDYEYFIGEIKKRSTMITGVDVMPGDKFLTLSTCATEWDDSRHAIVARKLRPGESEESIGRDAFQINPNPKWPAIYYRLNGGSYVEDAG